MQSGFEPKGGSRVRKDFVDFRQITCFKRFVHRNTSGSTDINTLLSCSLCGRSDIIYGVQGNELRFEEMAVPIPVHSRVRGSTRIARAFPPRPTPALPRSCVDK
jgi:hypothetical protein